MSKIKSCSTCVKGRVMSFTEDIMCPINGIVSINYLCSKYKKNDIKYLFSSSNVFKCTDCIHFNIQTDQLLGQCTLFSLRTINGSKKKTCAKFTWRKEKIEV